MWEIHCTDKLLAESENRHGKSVDCSNLHANMDQEIRQRLNKCVRENSSTVRNRGAQLLYESGEAHTTESIRYTTQRERMDRNVKMNVGTIFY